MKSLKKLVLLVASLVMAISVMAISASAAANSPEKSLTDAKASVSGTYTYSGSEQTAKVVVTGKDGTVLVEGKDYTLSGHKQTSSGTYTITITGTGSYKGTLSVEFTIKPSAEKTATIKTGVTKKTVKAASYAKKKKAVSFTFNSKNKGRLQVKVSGGNKKTRKKIKVVRKGKKINVVMPKGTKKGTYKIKVRVHTHNQYTKTVWKTFRVVVK